LSVEGKVKVTRKTENGKRGSDVFRELGHVNSTIQTIWGGGTEPQVIVRWT